MTRLVGFGDRGNHRFLDKHVFCGLTDLNNGFDEKGFRYFTASDFEIVLNRAKALGLDIYGIESWIDGTFFGIAIPENEDADYSDPAWYMKAFEAFKSEGFNLLYGATFGVSEEIYAKVEPDGKAGREIPFASEEEEIFWQGTPPLRPFPRLINPYQDQIRNRVRPETLEGRDWLNDYCDKQDRGDIAYSGEDYILRFLKEVGWGGMKITDKKVIKKIWPVEVYPGMAEKAKKQFFKLIGCPKVSLNAHTPEKLLKEGIFDSLGTYSITGSGNRGLIWLSVVSIMESANVFHTVVGQPLLHMSTAKAVKMMRDVVLWHQLGHWITDWIMDRHGNGWDDRILLPAITRDFREGLAQLFTWYAVIHSRKTGQQHYDRVFEHMLKGQDACYHSYLDILNHRNFTWRDVIKALEMIGKEKRKAVINLNSFLTLMSKIK